MHLRSLVINSSNQRGMGITMVLVISTVLLGAAYLFTSSILNRKQASVQTARFQMRDIASFQMDRLVLDPLILRQSAHVDNAMLVRCLYLDGVNDCSGNQWHAFVLDAVFPFQPTPIAPTPPNSATPAPRNPAMQRIAGTGSDVATPERVFYSIKTGQLCTGVTAPSRECSIEAIARFCARVTDGAICGDAAISTDQAYSFIVSISLQMASDLSSADQGTSFKSVTFQNQIPWTPEAILSAM